MLSDAAVFLTKNQKILQFSWYFVAEFAGNTRVVNQKELEFFREELQNRMSSSYNVILKEKKLPLSLLNDRQKVCISLSFLFHFQEVSENELHLLCAKEKGKWGSTIVVCATDFSLSYYSSMLTMSWRYPYSILN